MLSYKDFQVVMCNKCTGITLIKGRHDAPNDVGYPATCSCGGTYKIVDASLQSVGDMLGGYQIKREGNVVVGDIVEPLSGGGGGGWTRQLVLEVNREERTIRYARPFVTGLFTCLDADPHHRVEDYMAHYSDHEPSQAWVMVWQDKVTVYNYLEDRRKHASKEQLELYWQRLHFAIERECTVHIENEYELRHACMELEHRCIRVGVPVPEMPTKLEIENGAPI